MNMSANSIKRVCIIMAALFCAAVSSSAQDGAYSGFTPYSMFGVGDLAQQGNTYNKSMGGTGIASRNRKVINTLNPASVTARDSLSFMADFGVVQNNRIYRQGEKKSANNITNINDIAISFPVYRSSAMMFGLAPYSNVGYGTGAYVTDQNVIGHTGTITSTSTGVGSIYQLFAAAGVTFWKKLSLGAEVIYYFGGIDKTSKLSFAESTYNGITSGYDISLKGTAGKFGIQYEQPVGRLTLGLGATYKTSANLKGYVDDFMFSSGSLMTDTLRFNSDTLAHNLGRAKMAGEIGVGISIRQGERWRAELDYTYSDWKSSGMDVVTGFRHSGSKTFKATAAQSLRLGMEYVPNVNDIRYFYKRWSYKAGAYYNKEYYMLDGNDICSAGVTLGVTIPVFKGYNGVTLAVDLGQRGTLSNNLIRERYVNFTFGLNAFDIWFQKHRYQ